MVLLPNARHEILQERDEIRAQFWAGFEAFLPGGREEAAALYRATASAEGVAWRRPWWRRIFARRRYA